MKRQPHSPPSRAQRVAPPLIATGGPAEHVPVMVGPVIDVLAPTDGALYIDGTFGAGGYSRALLDAADCRVVAIDRDPEAVRRGHEFAAAYRQRIEIIEGNFGDMERLVAAATAPIAGIVLDLGVSSLQLDIPARGFSFRFDGPLDMRMGGAGQSAADLVAALSEGELAELIREYGEERHARRIARSILAARQHNPIRRTVELADIVRAAVPKAEPGLDPATRTFQALRIAVNDELGELDRGLHAAERLLSIRRPPRGGVFSLPRGSPRQRILAAAKRDGAARLATRAGSERNPGAELSADLPAADQTKRGRDRSQSASAFRSATRRRADFSAAMADGRHRAKERAA